MSEEDPLLSVAQVARLWGTGVDAVIGSVQSETLPSLDRGELVAQGKLDIPLIRKSWAEFMDLSAFESGHRIVQPPDGAPIHPACETALSFHEALGLRDAGTVFFLSSATTRDGHSHESLLAYWLDGLDGGFPTDSGVGTTAYTLAPLDALAARVFANAPKLPHVFETAIPATLLAVLPLVDDAGEWKVDGTIFFEGPFLAEILTSPLPPE